MSAPLKDALQAARRRLEEHPGSPDAMFNLAYYLGKDGQFQAAIEAYRKALKMGVSAPEEAQLNIANIYMDHLHDHDKAIRHFHQARSLNPRYAPVYHNLGNLAEQLGDRVKAARYFEKCLQLQPDNERALARLADTHRFKQGNDPLLNRLKVAALTSASSDLQFSLGRAYDQLGDHGLAWQHYSYANALDARRFPAYQPEKTASLFDRIARACDTDWVDRFDGESSSSVFICGMFRTGSTLLEQILAAHPSFTAGGESEFFPRLLAGQLRGYPESLATVTTENAATWRSEHEALARRITGGHARLTDKRPDNFLYAGLIKAVLPSAKFIVTERDWRDVAVSIFGTRLGPRQNYATRLEHIHHYIQLQRRLVDHWEAVLGEDLVRVSYEELVRQPQETVARLLHWLGEEWDERCLRFHQQEGAVRTASVWQVREPLHARSIQRWRNYREPLAKAFGEQG
ncbi:MAG: sulfotransferase [Xanthomonadales bacterium]|jgi:tetratricopeptide (TPR) repeat protein|nr:sulfotransferase [Xanthomonadales bacterium]